MRIPKYGIMAVFLVLFAAWVVVAFFQFAYNHGPAAIFGWPVASWWQAALTVLLVVAIVKYLRR